MTDEKRFVDRGQTSESSQRLWARLHLECGRVGHRTEPVHAISVNYRQRHHTELAREVVTLGLELGVPYEQTHTCYEGMRPACGHCDTCAERMAAFESNDVKDPLPYA